MIYFEYALCQPTTVKLPTLWSIMKVIRFKHNISAQIGHGTALKKNTLIQFMYTNESKIEKVPSDIRRA